jgi:hypothetical protein
MKRDLWERGDEDRTYYVSLACEVELLAPTS